MAPLISVIMPVKNVPDLTRVCIDSLQTYTPDHQLILVDDGSDQRTADYLKTVSSSELIRNDGSLGWCKAVNQGLELAKGNFVVLSNSDLVYTPKWSKKMVNHFNRVPELGALGPVTNNVSNRQNRRCGANGKSPESDLEFTDCLIFFCVMIRRDVIDKVGLLDEQFGLGGQDDADYCIRARKSGWKIGIARDVFVYHYGSATFREELGHDAKISKEFAESRRKILEAKHGPACWDTLEFVRPVARTFERAGDDLPSIFVGIPNRAMISTQLAMNLIYWKTCGKYHVKIEAPSGLFPLDNARNTIVKKFREFDFDYLWFIDADIVPPLYALDRLLAADKDIIGAVGFSYREERGVLFPYPVTLRYNHNKQYVAYYGKGIDWVDATGGACVLYKRRVFEQIDRPYEFVYHSDGTLKLTCDFKVFQKCQEEGFKIWIDFDVLCGHLKLCDLKGFQNLLSWKEKEIVKLKSDAYRFAAPNIMAHEREM